MARTSKNEKGETTYKYSEIFHSFQGEGFYTGRNTAWLRFFLCNLSCSGFGQKDPTDPSTYILPFEDFDVSSVKRIEDLPVWEYGCDSSYTWAKKFRHLAHDDSALQIVNNITQSFAHESNPQGLFLHPLTLQETHMAFTGGEPMLNQDAMIAIMHAFHAVGNIPRFVTVETNGTRKIKDPMVDMIDLFHTTDEFGGLVSDERGSTEWFWSCSPKLWSTAGEKSKKAICPDIVAAYAEASNRGQLKYVVNGSKESWKEVEQHTKAFREAGVDWDVYIMPVGATKEEQEEPQVAEIAMEAMKRGYHVSGRLHCYIFGNKIGT